MAIPKREARNRITLDRNFTPKFAAGLEYNPVTGEVRPRATWFATPSKGMLPSVVLGTSADRLSTERGNAVFLTLTQKVAPELYVFGGMKYGTYDRRLYFPFGANVTLDNSVTLQVLYDGGHTHVLVSKPIKNFVVSFVLARHRWPGLQIGFGF